MAPTDDRAGAGLGAAIPALPVRDVRAAVTHYAERFGFAVRHAEHEFAIVIRDAAELHLWEASDEGWRTRADVAERPVCSGAESFLAGTASCRIACADIDAVWTELAAAGVLHAVSQTGVTATDFGTREVAATDLDGNLLTFFATASATATADLPPPER